MGFEKKVLDIVSPALEVGDHAEFYNGTLFLEGVSDETGKIIRGLLSNALGKDKVQFSPYRDGLIAIDFK